MSDAVPVDMKPYRENGIITGASQTGKTLLSMLITLLYTKKGYNMITLDPNHKFANRIDDLPCFSASFVKHTLADIRGLGLEIYQPYENQETDLENLCGKIKKMRDVCLVGDEIPNYVKKFKSGNNLDWIVRNGNNFRIGYLFIFQAPQLVPSDIVRNSKHRWCFYLDMPTDIKYMKDFIGKEVEEFQTGTEQEYERFGFYKKTGQSAKRFRI